jgi:RNA polymerase primary sigma factor
MRKPDHLKQPSLLEALEAAKWTQTDLAKAVGISKVSMGDIINLQRHPTPEHQDAIQRAFGEQGVYIDPMSVWPDHQVPQTTPETTPETTKIVSIEELISAENQDNQQALRETLRNEALEIVQKAIKTLSPKQQYVINMRYGLSSGRTDTLQSIGKDLGRTKGMIGMIEQKALRRLRHPSLIKELTTASNKKG